MHAHLWVGVPLLVTTKPRRQAGLLNGDGAIGIEFGSGQNRFAIEKYIGYGCP